MVSPESGNVTMFQKNFYQYEKECKQRIGEMCIRDSHCTFRVMIFERSMILCVVVYNFVLVERNLLLFVIPYIIIIYSLRKEVDIMDYISVKAASEKWGISERLPHFRGQVLQVCHFCGCNL